MSNSTATFLGRDKCLAEYFEPVSFNKGALIFREGDEADCFYVIDDGVVAIQHEREELDSDTVLGFVGRSEVLGELALLDQKPRSASAYAHTAVQARRFDFTHQEAMARERPQELITLLSYLGKQAALKLRQANARLADALGNETDADVDRMVARAQAAYPILTDWPEERMDSLLEEIASTFAAQAGPLAEQTVQVTRMGNVPDKTLKNRMASVGVFRHLAGRKGAGLLSRNEREVSEWAAPVGVVFGLIPVTNPVATAIFKTLICLKSRNALILSFHRSTRELGDTFGRLLLPILQHHGAPPDLVQWVRDRNSRKKTEMFFRHSGVSLILATGGSSMVKAAYSSGRPAIGVGPGNAPALVCSDADVVAAASSIVLSKSFDNGLICGSEHNLVAVEAVYQPLIQALENAGAAVLDDAETRRFLQYACDESQTSLSRKTIGVDAQTLAEAAGITRPHPIRVMVVPTQGIAANSVMAREKMAPVLGLFRVADEAAGLEASLRLLEIQGKGHTAVIHSQHPAWIDRFASLMPASRILVNSPATQGVIGFTTGLVPSFTLGCGTFGGNSTTDNVSYDHLLNIKRLARYLPPTQPL
ncbi:MAG: aldehyde dehydrogenase family protein [Verrucomicrobiae bacterium]|nr:aldehyde dehydrogenase family protein [Verrucomicrobiae bacterium]